MLEWIAMCVLLASQVVAGDPPPPVHSPPPPPSAPPASPAPPVPSTPPADTESIDTPPPADTTTKSTKPRRVWIFIDRYKEAGGTVENEDDTTIAVRAPDGELMTFAKGRLVNIVTLAEPQTGGQDGIIHMRDGTDLRALIHADDFDAITYEIAGIRSRLQRDAVLAITLDSNFEDKYARFREAIKPNEVDKRLTLARWLVSEKRFDLAAAELRSLTKEVDIPEGRELLKQVEAQLTMERETTRDGANPVKNATAPAGARTPSSTRKTGPVDLRDLLPSRILSPDDVNIIRVYEVDMKRPPRMDVPPDAIRELITRYGSSSLVPTGTEERNRMFSWEPSRVLKLMFDLKARDLYSRVNVTSEPETLNRFRTKVHDAWLVPNCATSACHGGIDAGRFFLHRHNSKDERVRYTNLLILLRSKLDHPLVDFEDPDASLIIQHALPRDEARYPHPDVRGWKPVFTGSARSLRGETVQWMRSMYKPRPEYPVDYEPPRLEAIDRAPAAGDSAER